MIYYPLIAIVIGLVLFRALSVGQQYLQRRKAIREHGCQPLPSLPQKDPFLGIDVAFRMFQSFGKGRRNAKFKEQHDTYGLTFQSVALGKIRIFTIDPVNLRTILSTNFRDWGVEPLRRCWWEFLGKGVMDTDGSFWKHCRDLVIPLFKREQISDLAPFESHLKRVVDLIPRDGSTVDLQPLFGRLVLDFTTEFLLGESSGSLTDTPHKHGIDFLKAFHYGHEAIGKRTQLPSWTIFNRDEKFWQAVNCVRNYVGPYIDQAMARHVTESIAGKGGKYVLVEGIVRDTRNKESVQNQLLNTFLAAHDTTTVLMTNVFFHLARNPHVYQKLREEVLQIDAKKGNVDKIRGLRYLRNVVAEASRMNPVVGQSARIALQDTVLPTGGGPSGSAPVYVRKGTSVQLNFYALHRRPEVFGKDTDIFRPERWDEVMVGPWDFLPFMGGPRVCPAQQMALTQVSFTTARIVQQFKSIENRDPVLEFVEQYRVTTDSKNGCKIALIAAE